MRSSRRTSSRALGLGAIGVTWALSAGAEAAFVVDVGTSYLLPDRAGQRLEVRVTGTQTVEGLNFYIQVGDGGPELGGSARGPRISSVDIVGSTIFAGNNRGQFVVQSEPQGVAVYTLTESTPVLGSGVLAVLTVDTTGFLQGTWPLLLADTKLGTTDFAGTPIVITNGTIVVIPEPQVGVATLAAGASLVCGSTRRRRRRSIGCG